MVTHKITATHAVNRDARRRYTVSETYEAGIVLKGAEVKAVKSNQMNLKGSYISIRKGEAFLVHAHIGRYKPAGKQPDYNPEQARKLLLTKKELRSLMGKSNEKGLTIIPLEVYSKRGIVKVTLAVARGKRTYDKRETIKERELGRRLRKLTKQQFRINHTYTDDS